MSRNYGNRKRPIATPSVLLRQIFECIDQKGLYAHEVRPDIADPAHTLSRWRRGRNAPNVLEVEKMAASMGLEFVLVEKGQ